MIETDVSVKIAIDAMGGDSAPGCVVDGAALALERGFVRPEQLLLVGREGELKERLAARDLSQLEVLGATEVVEMDESPASAIRTKKDSSMTVAMKAVKAGHANAFVSAGNTGAVVAAASLVLGRLPGIARPGIAVPMPTRRGPCVVIDVGANIYCKPEHLVQYAIMAVEYTRGTLGVSAPTVGLLNIGEEEGKGNPLITETHALLQNSPIDYKGFIEGQDLMSGVVDVVVCEGFVGNVILKVSEGLASFVRQMVHEAFAEHPPRDEVAQSLGKSFQRLDYANYGGAPLLGVSAPVMIGHGRSDARAIAHMLKAAASAVKHDVNQHILERLEASGNPVP